MVWADGFGTSSITGQTQEQEAASAQAAQTSAADANKKQGTKTTYKFKGNRAGKPTSNRLSYPHDKVYTDHTDYVKFKFVEYNPPFASMNGQDFLDKDGKLTKNIDSSEALNIYNNSCLLYTSDAADE